MNIWKQQSMRAQSSSQASTAQDAGLRKYMLSVYNYMASGLILTGIIALYVSQSPAILNLVFSNPIIAFIVQLSPLFAVLYLSFRMPSMSLRNAKIAFWAFAALMGVSMSTIFLQYTGASVAKVFFITAGAFAALSLYGYTTKKDLSGMRTLLVMGVIGIIIASLVNFFLQSEPLMYAISFIGVLVFSGMTAYDTQRIKTTYYAMGGHGEMAAKVGIMGALSLYLDFINLFVMLLQLTGDRR
jgi:FtsH-binding integral membrane protein